MSRKIGYKLSGQKLEAALKFAQDLNMDLNLAAERALFWAIRQAYSQLDSPTEHNDGAIRPAGTQDARTAEDPSGNNAADSQDGISSSSPALEDSKDLANPTVE